MLTTLRIRDLAIFDDLTVEFSPGFTVLTGETGAGKSIVADALGLAAGDRTDASRIRGGAERAVIEAVFALSPRSDLARRLADKGLEADSGELFVKRELLASGGSRVFLNGSPCPLATLREAGDVLVELHGQHEHQSLLVPDCHLDLLDEFGGHGGLRQGVAEAHRAVLVSRQAFDHLRAAADSRAARCDDLARRIREIDEAAPHPGELEALGRERRVLQNAGKIVELLEEAVRCLYDGEPAAASLVATAGRQLAELARLDPLLSDCCRLLESARVELQEVGATLRDYRDRTDFDPSRLDAIESRRALLERLCLRHGDEEALLAARETMARELDSLEHLDAELARLAGEVAEAERRYAEHAVALSDARRRAAAAIAPAVGAQLKSLALERARFECLLVPSTASTVSGEDFAPVPMHARGAERAEFQWAANPGEPARPLSKVGSGGELSRVMLALHVVLEKAQGGRTLVFDEIDAGVGGAVADAIGARLAKLGLRHQVLCVTHLPQVAAHADHHYHVIKRVVGGRTIAEVAVLDASGRVEELARMLGGRGVTPASRRHAAELLGAASHDPSSRRRGRA
jgi:DNA repair protein RecN (Recombination protein N)